MRVGTGFDVHAFKEGKKLILGGVKIDYCYGLEGHSDADVLVHAIMDSLLGASGNKDIGVHFPDKDPSFKGISSIKLLEKVREIVSGSGYSIVNIDATVIMEKPRIAEFTNLMEKNISAALKINESLVNIKATTTEGLGFCGRKEGVAAQSIALLE